ncbi:hypothetical protein [Niabella aquatica]
MKTVNELNRDIINRMMQVHREFPELSKYIKEMSVKVSGMSAEGIDCKDLAEYCDSLKELVKKYSKTHGR